MITYRRADPQDKVHIERLLVAVGLPTAGVERQLPDFEVAEDGGRIVGTAGLEPYGRVALLRSVAVDPQYQGRGVARELVERRLKQAATAGIRNVYLLTTTAAEYFRKFGFEAISREEISPDVLVSEQFGEGSCDTAQAMRLDLNSVRTELRSMT
jgi:amino-acid N-acetyltransferase